MASHATKSSIILFLCIAVSRAVINLPMTNPHYSKNGVEVTIPWSYTDHAYDVRKRKWEFKNANMPDFKLLFLAFRTGKPAMSDDSPLKKIAIVKPAKLVIKNPNRGNQGTYRFELALKNGEVYQSYIQLIITEQPAAVVPDCPKIVVKNEGEDLTCLCKAKGGNPPPTASWVKDGNEINGTGVLNKTLSIKNITKYHAGLYVCEVASHVLTNESRVIVYVIGGESLTATAPTSEQTSPMNNRSKKGNSIYSAPTLTYIIIPTFFGGLVCGIILVYVLQFLRHWLKKEEKDQGSNAAASSSNYENVGAVSVPTYQELDLTKMDGGEKYQSLEMNTRSLEDEEVNEAGYNELNKVRNKDENYQALRRV